MEDRIIVDIDPFILNQKINVIQNNEITEYSAAVDELPDTLCNLAKQNNINHIDLKGNTSYLLKIKNDIINNKFEYQSLEVNII